MESTLVNLSNNIEVMVHLAQKQLDELTEMQAAIDEAVAKLHDMN